MRPGSNMVRKGAWTAKEDMLLKNCIEKYGEGKWHLVPLKAGLNRCRKSCRLRWLNYLRPNIKRGNFDEDEVDLILRLHKLLGNRWALIAGRIPGRTANDVKNYWNTHIRSRAKQQQKGKCKDDEPSQDTMVKIIKPLPRTLSKTLNQFVDDDQIISEQNINDLITTPDDCLEKSFSMSPSIISPPRMLDDNINEYLDELFGESDKEIIIGSEAGGWSFGGSSIEDEEASNIGEQENDQNSFLHFPVDEVTWDFFDW